MEDVGSDEEGRLAPHRTDHRLRVDCQGHLNLPHVAVLRRVFAGPAEPTIRGVADELRLDGEPLGTLLEGVGEGRLCIGCRREALVAQMAEGLLPLVPHDVHLALQRRPSALLALRRAHDHPTFSSRRERDRRPEHRTFLLPGVVSNLQRGPRLLRGVGGPTDPLHTRCREARYVVGTAEPASATKMGASSSPSAAARSWSASASTAATRLTLSLALPSIA